MKKNMFVKCVSAALFLGVCSTAGAAKYKVVDVSNGGSITGTIKFSGAPPKNPSLAITKDEDVCGGKSISADYYIVGANGGLKNVAVAIENIDAGKAYDKKNIIPFDNKNCMFAPHVTVGVKGQKLGIVSSDPVLHNTHLYYGEKLKTMYNIALPLQDKVIKKKLKKVGVVTVKCDAHEWMLGYVYVAKSPYVTVSAEDGSFTIDDVPPGNYKVTIWHEKLGTVSKDVTVAAGSAAKLDHTFSK